MNHAAQLARIGSPDPEPKVWICKLYRGSDKNEWLCEAHIAAARLDGWDVVEKKAPPHEINCQECPCPF